MNLHSKAQTMFLVFSLALLLCASPISLAKQPGAENQSGSRNAALPFSQDFSSYTGSGFAPVPAAGQLDSDVFRLIGMSAGDTSFGGTFDSSDFARGTSPGGVTTGGAYAFDVGSGNVAFGVQPGGSDFTPGSLDIRFTNSTGSAITELNVSYVIWVFNDQTRGSSLNFEWSTDDVNYTPVSSLDFTSPEAADSMPGWVDTARSTTISDLNISAGADFFLRWSSNDDGGSGSRDELAVDDIQISTGVITPDPVELTVQAPAAANAGDQVTYSISINNPSTTDDLSNVVVTSTLPTGLSYASDTSGVTPTQNANEVEWTFTTLAANNSIDFDLVVDSDSGIVNGTTLTNQVGVAADLSGSPVSDSASADTTFSNSDPIEIFTIQGEGLRSPFAPPADNGDGDTVTTENNVVTAVASNGFFMQMPDDRDSSSLPLASRGLFVFTGSTPAVAVGDLVDVTGPVVEFFESTQIGSPDSINVTSSSNPLPTAITFDATLPSPDPENLSCGVTNFECFEGMRVAIANGIVTGPNQSFGSDPVAEAYISSGGELVFRGKGAEFPGPAGCPGCPIWSGAPGVFEIDPDRFGLRTEPLIRNTRFSAVGIIGFAFNDYGLWPTELNITSEPPAPEPVNDFGTGALTIASLNALNFFDNIDNQPRPILTCGSTDNANDREVLTNEEYTAKLIKLSNYIVERLGAPDVLALQEVESLQTLQDLANAIQAIDFAPSYSARLAQGNDQGEINVGYLINETRVAIDSVDQLLADQCLTVDNSPLHDRPPLLLQARFIGDGNDLPFAVYNNHMRSLSGVAGSARNRLKRHEQAQSIAQLVQDLQIAEPDLPIIVIGDINAFEFSDGLVDVVGHLRGTAVPSENLVSQENQGQPGFDDSNIPNPPLRLPLLNLPALERYSFIFDGVAQTLDHALLDDTAWQLLESLEYARGNVDYSESFEFDDSIDGLDFHSSDHDGLVITLNPDRLFADSFEAD